MAKLLKCETNTAIMERKVRAAFRTAYNRREFNAVFEHGQWFVIYENRRTDETETYSVCDADTETGLDFERLG